MTQKHHDVVGLFVVTYVFWTLYLTSLGEGESYYGSNYAKEADRYIVFCNQCDSIRAIVGIFI